ncbi:hypothetical protein AWH69_06385 [Janibacter melonis]|uniref:EamA domain-containing protein n=1 Tax=Janibacter melonis TaxID=262209 RepID=A0A176QD45_9MICO|nr:EamA family transporter [Janibacter melonis]OAB87678.1 hypothetical protein AWH69_06385 [Janibacter melonis]
MTPRDTGLAALMALIWGSNFVVIEWGLQDVPPLLFAAMRFVLVLLPAIFLVPRPAVSWRVLATVGLTVSLGQFSMLYLALHLGMPSGMAALVLQVQVPLTIVIAAVVLHERVAPAVAIGVGVAVVGLAVVALGRGAAGLLPFAVTLLAGLSWAVGNVVVRAKGVPGGLGLTVWSSLVVPLPLLALSLLVDGPATVVDALPGLGWRPLLSTAWTAVVSTLVGYGIFYSLLHRNPSATVVSWVLVVPPLAILLAWVLQGDQPSTTDLVGAGIAMAGLAAAQLLQARARRAPVLPEVVPAR